MSGGPQSQRPSGNTPHRPHHRRGGPAGGEQAGSAALVERDQSEASDGEAGDDQGVWYEHVNLTGKDLFRALLWANGIVIAVCVFHAVMFLPPYGVFYDGPARPGHLEHHATDTVDNHPPHTGDAQAASGSSGGGQSDSGLAQSTVQTPHPPNHSGSGSGDAPSSTGTGSDSAGQSAAPPSSTSADTPLPEKPNTPHNLDDNSAIELANYYVDVLTYSADTGDTKPLDDLFAPNCQECANVSKGIRSLYDKGAWVEGISYSIDGEITTSRGPQQSGRHPYWLVHIRLLSSQHAITDLQSRKRHPASQTSTTLALCQHNTQWKICAIRQEPAQQSR
ncbi:MAG: DUF6318 family protein [Actinomycetaceae bacterium]|nr:DUF6318 family protein [Actinomycetaceae bacterium]